MIRKTRTVTVKNSVNITPNMKRIVFEGEDLKDFSSRHNGFYVKLVMSSPSKGLFKKPKVRPYTIRKIDDATKEMVMDFAIHEPAGPATMWALKAKKGDEISFMGPGPKKINTAIDGWYLFAADMSALPAASAAIEQLPRTAKGEVFFEILSEDDIQDIDKPEGVTIHWLIHKINENQQLNEIKKIAISDAPNVFVAGEIDTVKEIKKYLLDETKVSSANNVYISSYWKRGKTEEEHKRAKMRL